MRVRVGDQVEGDVDAAGIRRHGVGVLVDRVLVERVDLSGLGQSPAARSCSATASSVAGVPPGRKTGRPRGRTSEQRRADRSATSVDHGILVLEQPIYLLKAAVGESALDSGGAGPMALATYGPKGLDNRRTTGVSEGGLRPFLNLLRVDVVLMDLKLWLVSPVLAARFRPR